uniref:Chemokine interleukin-8-like domain-containing protein n=1 Tax=Junco hyemalis TaxID=40217 RepID=A0A8C5IZZ9_JUNHY
MEALPSVCPWDSSLNKRNASESCLSGKNKKPAEMRAAILEVNGNLSCRCAKTTSEYISPKKYESIEIRPVGSSCRRTEIIIKLRTSGKVCVNPEAPWVKKLLKRIASTKK